MESLLDLGMSLPSTMGHNDYEMPPKHGQICGYEGTLLNRSRHLPAAYSREGNGKLLQYSCLENPTDGGAW